MDPLLVSAAISLSVSALVFISVFTVREIQTVYKRRKVMSLLTTRKKTVADSRNSPGSLFKVGQKIISLTPEGLRRVTTRQLERAGFSGTAPQGVLLFIEIVAVLAGFLIILIPGGPLLKLAQLLFAALLISTPRATLVLLARRRSSLQSQELPMILDLMLLMVSGGLGLTSSFRNVVDTRTGVLAGELRRTLEDMNLGIKRLDALEALVARTDAPEVKRFADALMKVDQLGVSLTSVLQTQAEEIRHRRHVEAEERAQRITVKILFPLILCFLPGLFIVVLGPAIIDIFSALAT